MSTKQIRSDPTAQILWITAGLGVVGLAIYLRSTVVDGAYPYLSYVDEGHVLHPAGVMLFKKTWDPGVYNYPTFPAWCIALAAYPVDWIRTSLGSGSFLGELYRGAQSYDHIEPIELLAIGRTLVALFSLGTVLTVSAIALKLQGRRAAILSMLAAAVLPMLVSRSSIVVVDTYSAFFTVLSLCFALYSIDSKHPLRWLVSSGAAAGIAFTCKYNGGAVLVAVLAVVAFDTQSTIKTRVSRLFWCCAAFGIAAVITMPALLIKPLEVFSDLVDVVRIYRNKKVRDTSYLEKLMLSREAGIFILAPCVLGLLWTAFRRRSTRFVVGLGLYTALTLVVMLQTHTQPLRNMLPLVCSFVPFFGIPFAAASTSRRMLAGAGFLIGLLCLVPSLDGSLNERRRRLALEDSRVLAREWMNAELHAGSRVVVTSDLAFHPTELKRLRVRVWEVPTSRLGRVLEDGDVVVTSRRGATALPDGTRTLKEFGDRDPPKKRGLWWGKARILILEAPQ